MAMNVQGTLAADEATHVRISELSSDDLLELLKAGLVPSSAAATQQWTVSNYAIQQTGLWMFGSRQTGNGWLTSAWVYVWHETWRLALWKLVSDTELVIYIYIYIYIYI